MTFTYKNYESLLWNIKESFNIAQLKDAIKYLREKDRVCFLRHDVDLSVSAALDMALLEKDHSVKSTYHFFYECPFYSIEDDETQRKIKAIEGLGHEIGLHTEKRLPSEINFEIMAFERMLKTPIKSMSFHKPDKDDIYKKYIYYDDLIVYAYSEKLMENYISDSRGEFREDPINKIKSIEGQVLQLLIHPFWWKSSDESVNEKLKSFLKQRFYDDKKRLETHIGLQVEI